MNGYQIIADYAKDLPAKPGVYRMLDAQDRVLYVGKARRLSDRVASYSRQGAHNSRITRMISQTARMEFTPTRTETEALLLEASLIKKLRPVFNILLKDDKSYPYILIRQDHPWPQIVKHRGKKQDKGLYFGPFASSAAVDNMLEVLQKVFLLRSCADHVFAHRSRPCLLYQIKRCSAPCVDKISHGEYDDLIQQASNFLSGKSQELRRQMAQCMQDAASKQQFEKAARYRDRLKAITTIQSQQIIEIEGLDQADIIGLTRKQGQYCACVFFYRGGQQWGYRTCFFRCSHDMDDSEAIESFIGQFYQNKPPPTRLLLSHTPHEQDWLAQALSDHAGHKVVIHCPKRGKLYLAVQTAQDYAAQALARKISENMQYQTLLQDVAESFALEQVPQRIEIYDNSHIMGTHAVGAMVVCTEQGFQSAAYRTWKIKTPQQRGGDDYAMMREVFERRFQGKNESDWPDIILIDGGRGQLSAALDSLVPLNMPLRTRVIAIAKGEDRHAGREHFFMNNHQGVIHLPFDSQVLYFLQRLRDEAHRFAITKHRAKRQKSQERTSLEDIPGIGNSRRRALLQHFGSARAVQEASLAELCAVPGISQPLAQKIYDFFQEI